MLRIDKYIENQISKLKTAFGDRLLYIGLQGSCLRGEATEAGDIDIMAVIDGLSAADLDTYRQSLIEVGNFDKSCGSFAENPIWSIGILLKFVIYLILLKISWQIRQTCAEIYRYR